MKFRNLIIVGTEEKELKELPEEERRRLAELWNRRAAEAVNYTEVKTA